MQNRTRKKQIVIRMSEDEFLQIKQKVEKSGLSQQEYLIRACTDKKIIVIDGLREATVELKRIGNNLNQIARACNEGKANCKNEVDEIGKELSEVWQLLKRLAQKRV